MKLACSVAFLTRRPTTQYERVDGDQTPSRLLITGRKAKEVRNSGNPVPIRRCNRLSPNR